MPGYRLYRAALVGATGRVGEALTRQLLLSPLCSEVRALGRRETRAFDGLAAAEAKLRQQSADLTRENCGVDPATLEGVDAAFCVVGARGGWADAEDVARTELEGVKRFAELCAAARVPHISLLSSAWAKPDSKMPFARSQAAAAEAVAALPDFRRVSVFRPSVLLDNEGQVLGGDVGPLWARALWRSTPVTTQFMPTRFRPVALADLVLAMRLNVELCDASSRLELLDYRDLMLIIGRDSEI